MNSALQVIALSGTNGSGKDTVGKILAEHHNYFFISVTDLLREEAIKRGWPPNRERTRTISAEWRRAQGLAILVDRAIEAYKAAGGDAKYTGVVMSSLRNPGEVDRIHELGGTMIWIDADPHVRYKRVQQSSTARGDRAADDQRTFEQFLADQEAEMHPPEGADQAVLNMAAVRDRADITLENNGNSLEIFRRDIEAALGL